MRDTTTLSEIILHEKDFSPDSLDCQAPRIWNDQCSDCICDSSNEMWYYELGICDVRECSNPSEKLFIKNNQVICEEPAILDDFDESEEEMDDFEPLSQKIITLKFIDKNSKVINDIQVDYANSNYETYGESSDKGRLLLDYYDGEEELKAEFAIELDIDFDKLNVLSIPLKNESYNISNFFYLSEDFSEEKDAVEEIELTYKDMDYQIFIAQSEIDKIENHDILEFIFEYNENNFFISEIKYLDEYVVNTIFREDESDYIDISEGASYSECFTQFQMLENSYKKCRKAKGRDFKYIKEILNNYECNFDLNDYMNNIYLVNALYADVMAYTDEDFLCLFKINNEDCVSNEFINELNKFEYLDLIFQHMNSLNQDENSLLNITETNRVPYKANIFLKQVQFYYKYFELLYSLKDEIKEQSGFSQRGPRIYDFNRSSDNNRIRPIKDSSLNSVLLITKNNLEKSIREYNRYSEESQNWADYGAVEVQGIKNKIKWIKHEF